MWPKKESRKDHQLRAQTRLWDLEPLVEKWVKQTRFRSKPKNGVPRLKTNTQNNTNTRNGWGDPQKPSRGSREEARSEQGSALRFGWRFEPWFLLRVNWTPPRTTKPPIQDAHYPRGFGQFPRRIPEQRERREPCRRSRFLRSVVGIPTCMRPMEGPPNDKF